MLRNLHCKPMIKHCSKYCCPKSKLKANNFEEEIKFINQNPHWPQITQLIEKAEGYLSNDTDQQTT